MGDHGLTRNSLKIGVFGGSLRMQIVGVHGDALHGFNLPGRVDSGRVCDIAHNALTLPTLRAFLCRDSVVALTRLLAHFGSYRQYFAYAGLCPAAAPSTARAWWAFAAFAVHLRLQRNTFCPSRSGASGASTSSSGRWSSSAGRS